MFVARKKTRIHICIFTQSNGRKKGVTVGFENIKGHDKEKKNVKKIISRERINFSPTFLKK